MPDTDQHLHATYLVTGANRGIGLEFVRQLKQQGATVIATCRTPDDADELRKLLRDDQGDRLEQLDVADPESVQRLAERLGAGSGAASDDAPAIDVLVNNAGIPARGKTLAETDFDEVSRAFEVNAIGPLRVFRALRPLIDKGKRRVVVNVSSQLGSIANNTGGSSYGYRGSKAALNMVTKHLANELAGEGYACFVVHPGWVRTDMGGPNATLSTEESVRQLLEQVIEPATADTHNGGYFNYDGETLPW